MTPRGALLWIGVLALFLAIFVPLAGSVRGGTDDRIDGERLRRTYVALALYESSHDGMPAPNLLPVLRDVDASDLRSVDDPDATDPPPKAEANGGFPLDPALPSLPLRSKTRVSWTYRWHWPHAGDPRTVEIDARRGLLAGWWTGHVLRVNTDGALIVEPRKDSLTFGDLFGK